MRETTPRFAGIGGHHSHRAGTVEWLTPPQYQPGGWERYGLDPCAPIIQPHPTARRTFTILDDGLRHRWTNDAGEKETIWLNPPYESGVIGLWLAAMARHNRGTALIFARTETEAFRRHVWESATAVLFMYGRINFLVGEAFSVIRTRRTYHAGDVAAGNAGAPTVLVAYGDEDAEVLAASGIDGQFVALLLSRSVLGAALRDATWSDIVVEALAEFDEPVRVADLWAVLKDHPKAAGKPHARAKVRQTLQLKARSLGRDRWAPVQQELAI